MKRTVILILLLLQGMISFGLKPIKEYKMLPDSLGLAYHQDTIITPDNYKLVSWDISPKVENANNKTAIVFAYQDMGNMSYVLYNAMPFAQAGFHIVMFDYRGFGASQAFQVNENQLFYNEYVTDFDAVLKHTKEKYKGDKVGVWSASMGTIIATLSGMPYDFLIADSYITNLDLVKATLEKTKGKTFIIPASGKEYREKILKNEIPKIIFLGKQDKIIDRDIISKLKHKEVIDYDGGHLQGMWKLSQKAYGDVYVEKIEAFLKKNNF